MSPLPRQRKSGATRSCSQANIVPVRPNPVATSSAISSTPCSSVSSRATAQEAGRLHADPGGALDQRLDDHRRDLARVQLEHPLELPRVAGRDAVGLEQQRPVGAVEEVDAADRDRAQRVAVVGALEGDEAGPPAALALALVPVLKRHLERDLDRGRPGLGVEDALEPGRRDLDQARRRAPRRPGWVSPSMVEWATRSSCSRTAASISGWRWPWTLHHSEETPSM